MVHLLAERSPALPPQRDARLLEYVIDVVLLGRPVEYPADPASPNPEIMQAWAAVGRAVLREHPEPD